MQQQLRSYGVGFTPPSGLPSNHTCLLSCSWNMPANYDAGVFESCDGDIGEPMGVYGTSTFNQGQTPTPPPHPAPSSSNCVTTSTVGTGS
jgi:hypothetical protein